MPAASRPHVRRKQEDRRAESDRRILGAAMRLIARNGAAGTTLADIGIAAGYSRGLPAERFGTKQALLASLVDRTEEAFQAQLVVDVGSRTGLAAVEARIEAHLKGASRNQDAVRALYLLYMEAMTVAPELHARIAELSRAYRQGFVVHLLEAVRDGEIRADVDVRIMATTILGTLRGTLTQWLIDPSAIDLMAVKAALIAMVRAALVARVSAASRSASVGRVAATGRRDRSRATRGKA